MSPSNRGHAVAQLGQVQGGGRRAEGRKAWSRQAGEGRLAGSAGEGEGELLEGRTPCGVREWGRVVRSWFFATTSASWFPVLVPLPLFAGVLQGTAAGPRVLIQCVSIQACGYLFSFTAWAFLTLIYLGAQSIPALAPGTLGADACGLSTRLAGLEPFLTAGPPGDAPGSSHVHPALVLETAIAQWTQT